MTGVQTCALPILKSRPILTENQIQKNIEDQSKQIKSILGDVKVVNNFEWISQINLMEFLKELNILRIGKNKIFKVKN